MSKPRLVLCSGATIPVDDPRREGRHLLELDALGYSPNVNIRLEDVARVFLRHLTPRLVDLVEIAAYVYTVDAATNRGKQWTGEGVEPWSRDFRMVVPVRDQEFWERSDVSDLLQRTLQFLSDDQFAFDFVPLGADRPEQEYLQFSGLANWPFIGVPRVCLFSGGLDSLAGAIEMASSGEPLVLVSHRPVATLAKRQRDLIQALRDCFPEVQLLHIPVWVNKGGKFSREFSQRTRSFLFAALGMAVAESIQADGLRFFENGIVSLNLPVADEVLGARASRTTHPQALHLFGELFSRIGNRPKDRAFIVDNPFLRCTKQEVVERIARAGAAHLIEFSCSCAHTLHKSKSQWHCGTCSQCIDRRIAVLGAGRGEADPERDYVVNVFTGPRKPGYEQNMAVDYARHALELSLMDEQAIATKFNREITAAIRYEPQRRESAAELIDVHQRHAVGVMRVLEDRAREHVGALVAGELPGTSMLALVMGQRHRATIWQRYVERIGAILSAALPLAYQKERPKNELRLQEICDAVLAGHDLELRREYPFLVWASVRTKPDWSAEPLALWVELKYVRTRGDRVKVTDAIAADITKYGTGQRRTLFVIYDPDRHMGGDADVAADIACHDGMFAKIIR